MRDREEFFGTSLIVLLLIIWADFMFLDAPEFAGSLAGGIFAIAGSLLLLAPLIYSLIKRIKAIRVWVNRRVTMKALLTWHIYGGLVGSILVMVHTGNKFESPLGITLTAMNLTVVISGFIGRFILRRSSLQIREKQDMLAALHGEYEKAAGEFASNQTQVALIQPFTNPVARLFTGLFTRDEKLAGVTTPYAMVRLAEAIAEIEYSIKTHDAFNLWFGRWLKLHITISAVFYLLLVLHIWAAIHFGLRWVQ